MRWGLVAAGRGGKKTGVIHADQSAHPCRLVAKILLSEIRLSLKFFSVTSGCELKTLVFIGFAVRLGPRHYRCSDALKKIAMVCSDECQRIRRALHSQGD